MEGPDPVLEVIRPPVDRHIDFRLPLGHDGGGIRRSLAVIPGFGALILHQAAGSEAEGWDRWSLHSDVRWDLDPWPRLVPGRGWRSGRLRIRSQVRNRRRGFPHQSRGVEDVGPHAGTENQEHDEADERDQRRGAAPRVPSRARSVERMPGSGGVSDPAAARAVATAPKRGAAAHGPLTRNRRRHAQEWAPARKFPAREFPCRKSGNSRYGPLRAAPSVVTFGADHGWRGHCILRTNGDPPLHLHDRSKKLNKEEAMRIPAARTSPVGHRAKMPQRKMPRCPHALLRLVRGPARRNVAAEFGQLSTPSPGVVIRPWKRQFQAEGALQKSA